VPGAVSSTQLYAILRASRNIFCKRLTRMRLEKGTMEEGQGCGSGGESGLRAAPSKRWKVFRLEVLGRRGERSESARGGAQSQQCIDRGGVERGMRRRGCEKERSNMTRLMEKVTRKETGHPPGRARGKLKNNGRAEDTRE